MLFTHPRRDRHPEGESSFAALGGPRGLALCAFVASKATNRSKPACRDRGLPSAHPLAARGPRGMVRGRTVARREARGRGGGRSTDRRRANHRSPPLSPPLSSPLAPLRVSPARSAGPPPSRPRTPPHVSEPRGVVPPLLGRPDRGRHGPSPRPAPEQDDGVAVDGDNGLELVHKGRVDLHGGRPEETRVGGDGRRPGGAAGLELPDGAHVDVDGSGGLATGRGGARSDIGDRSPPVAPRARPGGVDPRRVATALPLTCNCFASSGVTSETVAMARTDWREAGRPATTVPKDLRGACAAGEARRTERNIKLEIGPWMESIALRCARSSPRGARRQLADTRAQT